MAFFKRTTMGKPIVMGRKQFESVGRAAAGADQYRRDPADRAISPMA